MWNKSAVKSKKLNRKKLVILLIATELVGILSLIWYLRTPLYLKYLALPPKKYYIEEMDPSKQYLLLNGDFITGKSSPSSILELSISPDGQTYSLLTDPQGVFEFQVPQELAEDEYTITMLSNDLSGTLETKNLKIRVESNSRLPKILNFLQLVSKHLY